MMNTNEKYRVAWNAELGRQLLSPDTLEPELGSVVFGGFRPGATVIIVLAYEDPLATRPSAVELLMLWGGMVKVQP